MHQKFEDRDLKETHKDSPICARQNLGLVFAGINSLDIQSAFLQGQHLERDIYLKPPKEANTKNIWKLKKCIYGMSQASRLWYRKVSEELQKLGVKKSKYDEAIFFWHHNNERQGIMSFHIDDFCWGGTPEFWKQVINKITKFSKLAVSLKIISYILVCS